jgi:L-fuconolactonase
LAVRVDAHQHFWHFEPSEYPWISEQMPALRRDRLPADLEPILKASGMELSIAVQARPTLEETHWLLQLSREHQFIRGVIGWFDLCAPEFEEQIDALPWPNKLVGVRAMLQDIDDDEYMLREDFKRGLKVVRDCGFSYDLLIYPRHLPYALKLVRQFPSVRFIVDHLAKPPIASGELEPWMHQVRELAHEPNVACKLSGMVTEAAVDWKQKDLAPFIDVVGDAFGEKRLIFGSDWPVCEIAATYPQVVEIVERQFAYLPQESREWIMGGNAARWYDLGIVVENRYPFA